MKPVEPLRFPIKSTRVEADPRSLDGVGKGARIGMIGTAQDDIPICGHLQRQRRAEYALPKGRCLANIRQGKCCRHAPPGDQKMITLQLNGARNRAKGVQEKPKKWSLL